MFIQLGVALLHLLLVWIFTFKANMGVYGPPFSISVSNLVLFLGMTVYSSQIQDNKMA
jgi:multidrug resistance protein, MATE family